MKYDNHFIADEGLKHKAKYLHKALDQTNKIIKILEIENTRLKNILDILSSTKKINTIAA